MKWLLVFITCMCFCACSETKKLSRSVTINSLENGSLTDAGIDALLISKMDSQIMNGTYPNIHSVLIARNNKLIFEKYYQGKDENWGKLLGFVTHHHDSLHDIRSVTKSIVSALVGIALAQGKIKSVDQKIFDFFPGFKHLDTGLKSQLTLKHLLNMSTGLVWNEEVPYTDSNNSEIRMIRSSNPIEFVLSQPMERAPGQQWKYNGGATQLLASVIENTTGKKVDEFADQYLFQPLGIKRYEWIRYPGTDLPAAASGLRLTSRDMLKFGLLYLNDGRFNRNQVVPADWVQASTQPQIVMGKRSYGYQFYLGSIPVANKMANVVVAIGNGNQRIFIDKENSLVVVVTAGNYNLWNIKNNSDALVFDFIYPALQ